PAVGWPGRSQTHHRLAALRIEDDAEAPGRQVVGNFDATQRRPPIAGDVDPLHRPAPSLLAIKGDKSLDQRLARHALQFRIQRGSDRKAAVDAAIGDGGALRPAVKAVLAD